MFIFCKAKIGVPSRTLVCSLSGRRATRTDIRAKISRLHTTWGYVWQRQMTKSWLSTRLLFFSRL